MHHHIAYPYSGYKSKGTASKALPHTYFLTNANFIVTPGTLTTPSRLAPICHDEQVMQDFLFLRQSSITTFFVVNQVDVPLCFNKSKSLFYRSFETPFLKLVNLFMRSGKREFTLRYLTTALLALNKQYLTTRLPHQYTPWVEYNFLLSSLNINGRQPTDGGFKHITTS